MYINSGSGMIIKGVRVIKESFCFIDNAYKKSLM